jgi:Ca2+-binding RTX toxin-like protein
VTMSEGDDIVLGGSGKDLIRASNGNNVVLGDNGFAVFNTSRALIEFDTTNADQGDRDFVLLGSGNDIAIGGTAADDLRTTGGNDILIGDNARIVADTFGRLLSVATKDPLISGADCIQSGAGDDIIFGGSDADYIGDTGGRNIVAGDNAMATFDANRQLRTLTSTDATYGGADRIAMAGGNDIIVAGLDRDVVNAGNGTNIVLGDHGTVTLDSLGLPVSLTTTNSGIGGDDVIYSGAGDDIVLAGFGNDNITAAGGSNIIVGDNGQVAWLAGGVLQKVNTLDAAVGGTDTVIAGAGDDVIIGGTAADTIMAGGGNNIVIGDSGCALFNSARKVVSLASTDPNIGAADYVTSDSGNDLVIGGAGNDRINVAGGNNVVLGDNGSATFNASGAILTLTTSSPEIGGADSVFTGAGNDVVLGGASQDFLSVGDGRNVVLGDHGNIRFDASGQWLNVNSSESTLGDADQIISGIGNDLIFGGTSSDTIDAGAGDNVVAGDSAVATFNVAGYLLTLNTVNNADGGVDTIRSGAGDDVVLGGALGDFILPGDGRNVVLGDAGIATFSSLGKLATLVSQETHIGGQDRITTGSGRDIIFGGVNGDVIAAGAGNNTIVGDSGSAVFDLNANMLSLTTINSSDGGNDMISTGIGKDVVFGGSGGDSIITSDGSNLVLGDNGKATFNAAGQWLTVESLDTSVGDNDNIVTGTDDDIVFGGAMNDVINVNNGRNIVVGDSAQATFDASGAIRTLQTIAPTIGGNDRVNAGTGNDLVFGGVSNDNLNAADGNNVLVGDNASATFDASGAIRTLSTTDSMAAGLDWITTGAGRDAILGGSLNDVLNAGNGVNLVLGDNGRVTFDGAGQWLTVNSIDTAIGGADSITGGLDNDTIFGGMDSDFVDASEGRNVVTGDSAQAEFNAAGQILSVTTIDSVSGGRDRITTGTGDDTIFGGSAADNITASHGRNIVAGDNAAATFDPGGQVRTVTTIDPAIGDNDTINSGINDDLILGGTANDSVTTTGGNNIILGDNGRAFFAADGTIQTVEATNPTIGGSDTISSAAGNDLIIAGTADDTVRAGAGNDLIFGDHGRISGSIRLTQLPLNTFSPDFMFTSIATQSTDLGGNDFILAGAGEDIIIGGQGRDRIHGESGDDDVIGGHSVADGHDDRDLIDGGEGNDYIAGDNAWIHREPRTTDTRWRAIVGPELLGVDGQGSVTMTPQADPGSVNKRTVTLFNHTSTTGSQFFGSDIIAGEVKTTPSSASLVTMPFRVTEPRCRCPVTCSSILLRTFCRLTTMPEPVEMVTTTLKAVAATTESSGTSVRMT